MSTSAWTWRRYGRRRSGNGEVLQKPMARVPGGLKAQVAVTQSPFRYLFRLPEGYRGSHGLEKALPRYDRFFHLLAHPLPPEWALGTVFTKEGARLRVPRGVDLLTGQEAAGEVEARYLLLEPVS
jgi:hypothetical protein